MQPSTEEPSSLPQPLDVSADPIVHETAAEVDPDEAEGACPHFPIPPIEERELGVNWWPPRKGAGRPPNISPTQWCLMSSVLRARIMAETSVWWASRVPPCPPPDDPPVDPVSPLASALVARRVDKSEVRSSPSARQLSARSGSASGSCSAGTKWPWKNGMRSARAFRPLAKSAMSVVFLKTA